MPKNAILTNPDLHWLKKLVELILHTYEDYPELFSKDEEEVIQVCRQLVEEKVNEK